MTIVEAVKQVMSEFGPLSPKEACERIMEKGLYTFKAQNPHSVVTSLIRRHCKGLDFPTAEPRKHFYLEPDGKFSPLPKLIRMGASRQRGKSALPKNRGRKKRTIASVWAEMRSLQKEYDDLLTEEILQMLKNLPSTEFEHFGKNLLKSYGFEDVYVTRSSSDGGIDGGGKLRVGLAHMSVGFECKRWNKSNVGRPEIDRFRGACQGKFDQGIFFTTAEFAPAAKEASIRLGAVPIVLVDGPAIVRLMIDKKFGVQEETLRMHTYALDMILSGESGDDE